MRSLRDLMFASKLLAEQLAYGTCKEHGKLFPDQELLWAHVVGRNLQYIDKMVNARCSLKESIEFDMYAYEEKIRSEFILMRDFLAASVRGIGGHQVSHKADQVAPYSRSQTVSN